MSDNKVINCCSEVTIKIENCSLTATRLHNADPLATLTNCEKHIKGFNLAFEKFNIKTCLRKAHFLAQVLHESGHLRLTKEGDNKERTYLKSQKYYPYVGRGLMQITWEENYKNYGLATGEDFLSTQNMLKLETAPHASQSAGWFYEKKGLNIKADKNDFLIITAKINGGFNGFDDRLKILKALFKEFNLRESTDYNFKDSEIYNDLRFSFGWGLWHDKHSHKFQKHSNMDNKDEAIKGYERVLKLSENINFPRKTVNGNIIKYYGIEDPKKYSIERLGVLK
ncbi:glycoside hydrolase family 19 protein [Arcobacter vandammei]|uniref:glycoside hydrolase family 19 protein n=1 Tax=Arcobacter vandammei TaxID=2782243 RepID=UPI0018DFC2DD|nr:hypothetical protein [Arcobacter vandammei]